MYGLIVTILLIGVCTIYVLSLIRWDHEEKKYIAQKKILTEKIIQARKNNEALKKEEIEIEERLQAISDDDNYNIDCAIDELSRL